MSTATANSRAMALGKARRLERFTILWNSLEALASLCAGLMTGSIALVGFGLDSVIETGSAVALLWRFRRANEFTEHRRASAEAAALRTVGILFLLLAFYIGIESASALWKRGTPQRSTAGVVIAVLALMVMPVLGRAKRKIATTLSSKALAADSRQSDFCACMAAITLCGVGLNALLGWWWADPAAALVMVPIIAREGISSLRGKGCGCIAVETASCCSSGSATGQLSDRNRLSGEPHSAAPAAMGTGEEDRWRKAN